MLPESYLVKSKPLQTRCLWGHPLCSFACAEGKMMCVVSFARTNFNVLVENVSLLRVYLFLGEGADMLR